MDQKLVQELTHLKDDEWISFITVRSHYDSQGKAYIQYEYEPYFEKYYFDVLPTLAIVVQERTKEHANIKESQEPGAGIHMEVNHIAVTPTNNGFECVLSEPVYDCELIMNDYLFEQQDKLKEQLESIGKQVAKDLDDALNMLEKAPPTLQPPANTAMSEHEFWSIMKRADDCYEFKALMETKSDEMLISFNKWYEYFNCRAYTSELWCVTDYLDCCSDDVFIDFRAWLITKGEEFYKQVVANPDCLVEKLPFGFGGVWSTFCDVWSRRYPDTFINDEDDTVFVDMDTYDYADPLVFACAFPNTVQKYPIPVNPLYDRYELQDPEYSHMTATEFWEIVEQSKDEPLDVVLVRLTKEKVLAFQRYYTYYEFRAYNSYFLPVLSHVTALSESDFYDAIAWAISLGKTAYKDLVLNPERIVEYEGNAENYRDEEYAHMAEYAYSMEFAEDVEDDIRDELDIIQIIKEPVPLSITSPIDYFGVVYNTDIFEKAFQKVAEKYGVPAVQSGKKCK